MDELRDRYEKLTIRRDESKKKHIEAQAVLRSLENREAELAVEAAQMGVPDLDQLDTLITELEEEIIIEMNSAEQLLDHVEAGQPVQTSTETKQPSEQIELDDLLNEGGSPQRRTKPNEVHSG